MLEAFKGAYTTLTSGAKGPQKPDDAVRQQEAATRVLGADGFGQPLTARARTWHYFHGMRTCSSETEVNRLFTSAHWHT
jgi:hypothetical protein